MVRVFYEPPHMGQPLQGLHQSGFNIEHHCRFTQKISKMKPNQFVFGFTLFSMALCWIPIAYMEKLPFTFDPEYVAANRAYMRYHNMNPISGISSKQSRAADP